MSIVWTLLDLSKHVERIMVKTGPEKKMAVESPIGRRSTDSLISQRKIPPRIPWATSLHRVAIGIQHLFKRALGLFNDLLDRRIVRRQRDRELRCPIGHVWRRVHCPRRW